VVKAARALGLLAALGVLQLPGPARAQEAAAEPVPAPDPAVASRLYPSAGRFEVGVHGGLNLLSLLTDAYTLGLSVAYAPAEWGAVELRVGHAFSSNSSLARDAARRQYELSAPRLTELRDTWRLGPHALAGFRFQPLYGKVSLLAEVPVHFQLYAWAGAGAVLLDRTSPSLCLYPQEGGVDPGRCVQGGVVRWDQYLSEARVSPLVSLALGLRLYLARHHALSLEVRSWHYLDRYYQDVARAQVSPTTPTGGGALATDAGLTSLAQLELGYAFVF
jgi:outer membrane beta-barrel protein